RSAAARSSRAANVLRHLTKNGCAPMRRVPGTERREFGIYLVSEGTNQPYKCKIRAHHSLGFTQKTGHHARLFRLQLIMPPTPGGWRSRLNGGGDLGRCRRLRKAMRAAFLIPRAAIAAGWPTIHSRKQRAARQIARL